MARLRLAFGFGYWVDKPLTHDEREYLALARNLAEGRGLHLPARGAGRAGAERFGRAPLYPLFLAVVTGRGTGPLDALAADQDRAVHRRRARRVARSRSLAARVGGPPAGAIAAWIAALYPPLVWIPAYVLSEALYMALALGLVAAPL